MPTKLNEAEIMQIAVMLLEASSILLSFRKKGFQIHKKSDGTRVSDADIAVNRYICDYLDEHHPKANIISEEGEGDPKAKFLSRKNLCFCIDPLDGTEAYIYEKDEYAISLGVISQSKAIYGWIAVPAESAVYYCNQKAIYCLTHEGITQIVTKEFEDRYIMPKDSANQIASELHEGFIFQSSALKFITLAKGLGHSLVQTHHTKIWDVAGGFALLGALGCAPLSCDGHEQIPLNQIHIPPFYLNI